MQWQIDSHYEGAEAQRVEDQERMSTLEATATMDFVAAVKQLETSLAGKLEKLHKEALKEAMAAQEVTFKIKEAELKKQITQLTRKTTKTADTLDALGNVVRGQSKRAATGH